MLRNLAADMMSDYFPAASPTAIGGFVSELFATKQTRLVVRQSLRAFGDPRLNTTFEDVAEDFIKVAEEAER